jgi:hypothetical protein
MSRLLLFADVLAPADSASGLRGTWATPELRGRLIMVLAILIAISIPIIWAVYFRNKRRHRKHHHHMPPVSAGPGAVPEAPARFKRRKKRRRSSHPNRALNPTLAETGGLPPIRREDDHGAAP